MIRAPKSEVRKARISPAGRLAGRKILLGVTGGIAAYKACQLAREIIRAGGEVQTLMSAAAKQFVGPLTFATITGRPVSDTMFPDPPPLDPVHLMPGHWGEILVVAPATADFIGKMAAGLADDIPSAAAMMFRGKILLAPAMNPQMWDSPAVQSNIRTLQSRGVYFVGPESGEMGGVHENPGVGRMSEPEAILDRIEELLEDNPRWTNRNVIVTTGPTREPIDPVRFIGNRSSGRMGVAIARAAKLMGAKVTLIRGLGATIPPPAGVECVDVDTAAEMAREVKRYFPKCDLLVMTAAVADWTPAVVAKSKLKKDSGAPRIELKPTEDILEWAGKNRKKQVLVGFALETDKHLANARNKLNLKNLDIIALNDPTHKDSIYGGETIRLTLLQRKADIIELPVLTKLQSARRLLECADNYLPKK